MLDPNFKAMLEAAAAAGGAPIEALGASAAREFYRSLGLDGDVSFPDLDIRDLTVAGGAGPIKARLYAPKTAKTPGPKGGNDFKNYSRRCARISWAIGLVVLWPQGGGVGS